jgi:RNA polymerase sigma-70 factor (ECF subfamily)
MRGPNGLIDSIAYYAGRRKKVTRRRSILSEYEIRSTRAAICSSLNGASATFSCVLESNAKMTSITDDDLMAAYAAGDVFAFDEIFRRYAPVLLRALRRGSGGDDATDLLQQTFLQLHRSRADFARGSALRPWLFTIAINVKRQHLRRLARHREDLLGDDLESVAAPARRSRREDLEGIAALLAELPPEQRKVIELHFLDDLSFAQVAKVVGVSIAAVRVRAHRGYVLLRQRFAEKVHTE